MFYKIRRMALWLRRCPYSRGFGVQSPSAYRFIRYVVNEHYPYYAYDDLRRAIPGIAPSWRRQCRLYFRIANYAQAEEWWEMAPEDEAVRAYVEAGCHKTRITRHAARPGVIRMAMDSSAKEAFARCLAKAPPEALLIVEGIHRSKSALRLWRRMADHPRTSVSFDLYTCGILFFDKKRIKQHYIVNF